MEGVTDSADATFAALRPKLTRVAYRMLGSVADAEDMVQDAWLRWRDVDRAAVRVPEAFLRRIVTRLCLDLRGDLESEMIEKCAVWYRDHIAPFVTLAGRVAIEHHRQQGHTIVLATGSTVYAATPVASSVGIEHVLSSRLEVDGGAFTGRPSALCFGHHKVALAEQWAVEHGIDLAASTFYSDSYNDLPMLSRVGTPVAVNPDARLRRHAKRHGWAIQSW